MKFQKVFISILKDFGVSLLASKHCLNYASTDIS